MKRREFQEKLVEVDPEKNASLVFAITSGNIDQNLLAEVLWNVQGDLHWTERDLNDFFPVVDMTSNTFKFD